MKTSVIKSELFNSSQWSGGSTTELYIHPVKSEYKKFNFDFRLSTATVEVETSVFTPLPGVSRTLMVLEGEMKLMHKDRHEKIVKPLDIDQFKGDWHTISEGKCVDFNLMTRGATSGTLTGKIFKPEEKWNFLIEDNSSFVLVYAYSGQIEITLNTNHPLHAGDLFCIEEPDNHSVLIKATEQAKVVICAVSK